MGYVKSITDVKKVAETTDLKEVNTKLNDGWMLLQVTLANDKVLFSIGKI